MLASWLRETDLRFRILFLMTLAPVVAQAGPREAQERTEVVRIFDLLTSKLVAPSDVSDVACVFSNEWEESYRRNARGDETEAFRPRELLTLEQALDPGRQHVEMFCDRTHRDKEAQLLANARGEKIKLTSKGFSYPVFSGNAHSAIVYYWSETRLLFPAGNKRDPADSVFGKITLRLRSKVWTYEIAVLGQS